MAALESYRAVVVLYASLGVLLALLFSSPFVRHGGEPVAERLPPRPS